MPEQLWANEVTPSHSSDTSTTRYSLGTQVTLDADGVCTAVHVHLQSDQDQVGDVGIFDSSGTLLATVSTAGWAPGWNTIDLVEPLDMPAGGPYTVALHTGRYYAYQGSYGWPVTSEHMHTPSSDAGRYVEGNTLTFPTSTYGGGNYFTDLVIDFSGGGEPGVHEVSGTGQISIDNPDWLTVELHDIPAWAPSSNDDPPTLYHVGRLALGIEGWGFQPPLHLSREVELVRTYGKYNLVGFALPDDESATITEHVDPGGGNGAGGVFGEHFHTAGMVVNAPPLTDTYYDWTDPIDQVEEFDGIHLDSEDGTTIVFDVSGMYLLTLKAYTGAPDLEVPVDLDWWLDGTDPFAIVVNMQVLPSDLRDPDAQTQHVVGTFFGEVEAPSSMRLAVYNANATVTIEAGARLRIRRIG